MVGIGGGFLPDDDVAVVGGGGKEGTELEASSYDLPDEAEVAGESGEWQGAAGGGRRGC